MAITASEAKQWLLNFHTASTTLNTSHWLSTYFSPTVTVTYANMPPITGRSNCELFFNAFLKRLDEMTHVVESFDYIESEQKILQAAKIKYRIKGDGEEHSIEIPGFAAFVLERDAEGDVRVGRCQTWLNANAVIERVIDVFGKEQWEADMKEIMQKMGSG